VDRDLRPVRRQASRNGGADPARRAGDECDFPGQVRHRVQAPAGNGVRSKRLPGTRMRRFVSGAAGISVLTTIVRTSMTTFTTSRISAIFPLTRMYARAVGPRAHMVTAVASRISREIGISARQARFMI